MFILFILLSILLSGCDDIGVEEDRTSEAKMNPIIVPPEYNLNYNEAVKELIRIQKAQKQRLQLRKNKIMGKVVMPNKKTTKTTKTNDISVNNNNNSQNSDVATNNNINK